MKQHISREQFKDVKAYEGFYQVSNRGNVLSLRFGKRKILKPQALKVTKEKGGGYLRIGLHKDGIVKMVQISRLVAAAFIPNPNNKPQINHKDGDKSNNCVDNLEWCTQKENNRHAYETGLNSGCDGQKNGRAKLTADDVREIRTRKFSVKRLAGLYKVSETNIYMILNRERWIHI